MNKRGKKYKKSKATASRGVAFVQAAVDKEGSIFRKVPEDTDIGIDAYIEFVEDEISVTVQGGV